MSNTSHSTINFSVSYLYLAAFTAIKISIYYPVMRLFFVSPIEAAAEVSFLLLTISDVKLLTSPSGPIGLNIGMLSTLELRDS
jgi:hypothetical protein